MNKPISWALIVLLLFQTARPVALFALTSGPSQPEYSSFAAVNSSNHVDPFTGDFSYSIPLLEVGSFPINLTYNAGVKMDQEASWVGLGWNIDLGAITRTMNGIPDDFKGTDRIKKQINIRPNKTVGVGFAPAAEFFGFPAEIKADMGIVYNNYRGLGFETGISITSKESSKNATANLSYSTMNGFGASIGVLLNEKDNIQAKVSAGINSRSGQVSMGLNMSPESIIGQSASGHKSISTAGQSFFPKIENEKQNLNFHFIIKLGAEFVPAVFANGTIKAYYSEQGIKEKSKDIPGYGYLYLQDATSENVVLDFNRFNDDPFSPTKPSLPYSKLTYDQFTFSTPEGPGSFRLRRSDIGVVHDPKNTSNTIGGILGLEPGVGYGFELGVNVGATWIKNTSTKWDFNNGELRKRLAFVPFTSAYPGSEPAYFKKSGELTSTRTFYNNFIADKKAVRIGLKGEPLNVKADTLWKTSGSTFKIGPGLLGLKRDKRAEAIGFLTAYQAGSLDQFKKINYYPVNQFFDNNQILPSSESPRSDTHKKPHHISVFNITKPDGKRYVYANPVYNLHWEEAVFNVGSQAPGSDQLVNYLASDANITNKSGKDHFFSRTSVPGYAYSYLLTSILSNDYIDISSDGPTPDDFGDYVKFNHSKIHDSFNWRTPSAANDTYYAAYQENMYSRQDDNYGSFQYGQKEICYPHSIETKNYVAVFVLSNRKDAFGVIDAKGAMDFSKPLKKLDAIKLYTRADLEKNRQNAVPIKTIVFEYDYSLCPEVPNNSNLTEIINNIDVNAQHGKLTLKKVSFVYGISNRGYLSPYRFEYSNENPAYNRIAYDRWGHYKPESANPGLNNIEYPYTCQNKTDQDRYASAWNLTAIQMPSGGKLDIEYESDDYAYVQNVRAGRMFKVAGIGRAPDFSGSQELKSRNPQQLYLYVQLDAPVSSNAWFRKLYTSGMQNLYYNCYVDLTGQGDYDYIKGYGEIEDAGVCPGNPSYGWIRLKNVSNGDWQALNLSTLNPITKSALRFARANLQDKIFPQGQLNFDEDKANLARSLLGVIADFASIAFGMNTALISVGYGNKINKDKSWVRLFNPDGFKLGGGHRVKSIKTSDNWIAISGSDTEQYYGQTFEYTTQSSDGNLISSGVASYEPLIGGDENSMKTPVFYKDKSSMLSENVVYVEKPYTESCFPSPSVGYSEVKVVNLPRPNAKKRGTGHTVYKYFTANTHPTIDRETDIKMKRLHPALTSVTNFLLPMEIERTTVSKGYYTLNNDMHGKLISNFSYSEFDDINPVSGYELEYFHLGHPVPTVNREALLQDLILGKPMDITVDSRVEKAAGGSLNIGLNLDFFFLGYIPVITLTGWPEPAVVSTSFKSLVVNKTDFNAGIIKAITTWKDGSFNKIENKLFNAETGGVVCTAALNEFGDWEYSTSYPAYWMHPLMGTANDNLGEQGIISLNNGAFNAPTNGLIFPGDELLVEKINNQSFGTPIHCWTNDPTNSGYTLQRITGQYIPDGNYKYKVIRSGKRNNLADISQQILSLAIPSQNNFRNYKDSIIRANSASYSDQYDLPCSFTRTELCQHADCLDKVLCAEPLATIIPYQYGVKGRWHIDEKFLYNTGRNYAQNSNANWSGSRFDGLYDSFEPHWKYNGNTWVQSQDPKWIRVNKPTIHTLEGNEVESVDALGIYSSALYGYNQTLPVAVANNTGYEELFYDNMEEYEYLISDNCSPLSRKLLFDFSTLSCLNELQNADIILIGLDPLDGDDPDPFLPIDTLPVDTVNSRCSELFITDVASHTGIYSFKDLAGVKYNFPIKDTSSCIDHFSLKKNRKYLISLWVQERDDNGPLNSGFDITMQVSFHPDTTTPLDYTPTGIRIEGWQKMNAVVVIPDNVAYMTLKFESEGNYQILLDDFRIAPWSGIMKSYVYHPTSIQLMAKLDENNYATFYEYDTENNLTRIKRETERGIQSVSESNFNLHKTPPGP